MQNIRALKTEADYNWALAEVEAYFDNLPEPGSEAAERFDVLTDLVNAYEARNWPIEDIDLAEARHESTSPLAGEDSKPV